MFPKSCPQFQLAKFPFLCCSTMGSHESWRISSPTDSEIFYNNSHRLSPSSMPLIILLALAPLRTQPLLVLPAPDSNHETKVLITILLAVAVEEFIAKLEFPVVFVTTSKLICFATCFVTPPTAPAMTALMMIMSVNWAMNVHAFRESAMISLYCLQRLY
jgi:hypothetical protein